MLLGQKIFKWLWLSAWVGGLVLAGVLGWFNSFLYTPSSLEAVRLAISEKSGLPLHFDRAGGNILEGLRLHEAAVHSATLPPPGRLLQVPILLIRFNPAFLLINHLVIPEVKLSNPKLTLISGPDHQILWPSPSEAGQVSAQAVPGAKLLEWLRRTEPEWNRVEVENGTLSLQSPPGNESLQLSGISGTFKVRPSNAESLIGGRVQVNSLMAGPWTFTNWKSTLKVDQGAINCGDFSVQAYGGQLSGTLEQKFSDPQLPFSLKVNASSVVIHDMLQKLFSRPDAASGLLSGTTTWRGSLSNAQDLSGKGSLTAADGQLIHIYFFQELSKALGVKELSQPDYRKCRIDFVLESGVFSVSSLVLNSALFDLSAHGTVTMGGTMNLHCELVAKPDLVKMLAPPALAQFPPDADGNALMKFDVRGGVDNAQTDLWSQLFTPVPPPLPVPPAPAATPDTKPATVAPEHLPPNP